MYTLIYNNKKTFVLDVFENLILLKNEVDKSPNLLCLANNFEMQWKLRISHIVGNYLDYDKDHLAFFDDNESLIINKYSGSIIRKEPRVYLYHDDLKVVYCNVLDDSIVVMEYLDKITSIDFVNGQKLFIEKYFIQHFYKNKIIYAINLENGTQIWQLNFCDLLQNDRAILHSEIIEQEGKLYFVLDGAENRGTFCVDIESGEVLAKYTALQGWLVKDGDYIYTIRFSETVVRLDTRTNEIVEWDIQELNGIGLIAEVAQNGFIYFVQNIGVTDPKVGVLDFDNRELVWSYSFTGNHGLIGSIKVHGNRLFVHTQDNTLHIFEKE